MPAVQRSAPTAWRRPSFKFHNLHPARLLARGRVTPWSVAVTPVCYRGALVAARVRRCAPGLPWSTTSRSPTCAASSRHGSPVAFAAAALRWRLRTRPVGMPGPRGPTRRTSRRCPGAGALRRRGITRVAIFADVYTSWPTVEDAGGRWRRPRARPCAGGRRGPTRLDWSCCSPRQMDAVVNPRGKPVHRDGGTWWTPRMAAPANPPRPRPSTHGPLCRALRREYGLADLVDGFRPSSTRCRAARLRGRRLRRDGRALRATDPRSHFHGTRRLERRRGRRLAGVAAGQPSARGAEFTKYSFPSKNMEYLASGTAVLTTRLPGMPAEYYEHVLTIDRDGPEAVADALRARTRQATPCSCTGSASRHATGCRSTRTRSSRPVVSENSPEG